MSSERRSVDFIQMCNLWSNSARGIRWGCGDHVKRPALPSVLSPLHFRNLCQSVKSVVKKSEVSSHHSISPLLRAALRVECRNWTGNIPHAPVAPAPDYRLNL